MAWPRPSWCSSAAVRGGAAVAACLALLAGASCGEEHAMPEILEPPADAAVFEGQATLFQVWASGREGLTYQWRRDGAPIDGARDSHLVLTSTALADDGARISVDVTNGGDTTVASAEARLTVYPALDLRFQWVGAPYVPAFTLQSNVPGGWQITSGGAGSPLLPDAGWCTSPNGGCSWSYLVASGVPGMTITYTTGLIADLPLAPTLPADAVVTSLDLVDRAGVYAAAFARTTQRGAFTPVEEGEAAPADLPAVAASEGAAGRVITAVSHRGGNVHWLSHGWTLSGATTYEARVEFTTFGELAAYAGALAAEGFVLTAVGTGDGGADGIVLVGTRPRGSVAARPILVTGDDPAIWTYHLVGYLYDPAAQAYVLVGEL